MEDHRINRTKKHSMECILFITLAAVICGAETWDEIEEFGNARKEWIAKYVDIPNGIPSHDTFNRFFSSMDTAKFEKCFRSWITSLGIDTGDDIIPIDGKTIRGSLKHDRNAIHMVSAWSCNAGITLAQIKTPGKVDEINVIPELLDSLFMKGSIVTIDAIGCHYEFADKIVSEEKQGNYVLQVKKNQMYLYRDIQFSFKEMEGINTAFHVIEEVDDKGNHGRMEKRTYTLLTETRGLRHPDRWKSVKGLVKVEKTSVNRITGEEQSCTRYYIASITDVKQVAKAIRGHWGIENNLHWMLDVAFSEDANRKRNENAVVNFSMINKIALYLLKKEQTSKMGVKSRRMKSGWDIKYLERVMGL